MPARRQPFSVLGTVVDAPACGDIALRPSALVEIDEHGWICAISDPGSAAHDAAVEAADRLGRLHRLADGQYLLPGLVDLHIHAPQWPQLGKALHLPLDEWLQRCTFPLEARYADLEFARRSYESLVDGLLANGTTTATYYGTVHLAATCLLAEVAHARGQRAIVGKVAMDNPAQCPAFYRDETTAAGLDDTRALIEHVRGLGGAGGSIVLPAVTPRFIPSCTDDMLERLGRMAAEFDCHVQTHCSESDWQHAYVIDRHGVRDTQSLDRFGLLTDKTILAHAVLIDDGDMSIIRERQSGIAHCPYSNLYFSHAVFPARRALDRGLKVGLGSDISGGPSPGILHNCQHAVNMSRALEDGVDASLPAAERGTPGARISFREAFWMATAGGGRALGLPVGRIAPGFAFDAIVVDTAKADSDLCIWPEVDSGDDVVQKIVYNANRHNIVRVWIDGRLVRSRP